MSQHDPGTAIRALVPADCDLRDFPYMPVDIVRLFGSEFHATSSDAGWRAGVTLWLKSYHQVPAASLPDDDAALARLAEFGRDVRGWRRVRDDALHGWVRAPDNRLYHPVVATKALEAWIEKLVQRKASAAANAKRWGNPSDGAVFDDAIEQAAGLLHGLHPQSKVLSRLSPRTTFRTPPSSPEGNPERSPARTPHRTPADDRPESQEKGREVSTPIQEGESFTDGRVVPLTRGVAR